MEEQTMVPRPVSSGRWRVVMYVLGAGAVLAPLTAGASPLAGKAMYVSPHSDARRTAEAWRRSRPADAAAIDFIARQPTAYWIGGWRGNARDDVAGIVQRSARAGAVPVLVAYNIPHRDCGSHSRGGEADGDRYRRWIRDFARGLGRSGAIVILEPDALAAIDCLDGETRAERIALLRDAIGVLKKARAVVYLDAGHARWHSADVMARRLIEAGVRNADGFALNVANYVATDVTVGYGQAISRQVGGKHFIIDTSRNGLGTASAGSWCNAPGQALGHAPTTRTGHPLVDAYLWVKLPGESDGRCGGGPPAGHWWPEYALGLARRALGKGRV